MHSCDPSGRVAVAVLALSAVLAAAFFAACGRRAEPAGEGALETIDVPDAPTIDPGGDPHATRRAPELVGVLPAHFPNDLALHLPASVADFGPAAEGGHAVTFLTPDPAAAVRDDLRRALARGGWTVVEEDAGRERLEKDGRTAWLVVEDGHPGSLYRFEYRDGS